MTGVTIPPSPAWDPQPAGSSQRCTSSPPVDWTSCTPGCSRCVSSRLGKTGHRSHPRSLPANDLWLVSKRSVTVKRSSPDKLTQLVPWESLCAARTQRGLPVGLEGRAAPGTAPPLGFCSAWPLTPPQTDPCHPLRRAHKQTVAKTGFVILQTFWNRFNPISIPEMRSERLCVYVGSKQRAAPTFNLTDLCSSVERGQLFYLSFFCSLHKTLHVPLMC